MEMCLTSACPLMVASTSACVSPALVVRVGGAPPVHNCRWWCTVMAACGYWPPHSSVSAGLLLYIAVGGDARASLVRVGRAPRTSPSWPPAATPASGRRRAHILSSRHVPSHVPCTSLSHPLHIPCHVPCADASPSSPHLRGHRPLTARPGRSLHCTRSEASHCTPGRRGASCALE